LSNRDIDRVGSPQIEVEAAQKCLCHIDIGRVDLFASRRAAHPRVESGDPARASSAVISLIRTRRAIAEANSAAAKSLTITTGVLLRMKASARGVSTIGQQRNENARG
jgi:hypothetical protein